MHTYFSHWKFILISIFQAIIFCLFPERNMIIVLIIVK